MPGTGVLCLSGHPEDYQSQGIIGTPTQQTTEPHMWICFGPIFRPLTHWTLEMGITIQQYRAAIGRWHGGRMKTLSTPTAPEQINTADCYQDNQNAVTVLRGPWKLHAAALALLMASLLIHQLAIWPFPSGSTQGLTSSNQVCSTSISHLELMDGKSSCIALQCLKALLLIGGVEPNTGPHKNRDQQIEIQREILADLCADAPDTTVRDTLYDPQLDTNALVKQINRTSKQNIVACLIYLWQPAMTDYKKDTCVNALICRIQNLFPDDCVFCKEEYCIKLTDTPLLSCKICGQGAHSPCILNHIQLQATETLRTSGERSTRQTSLVYTTFVQLVKKLQSPVRKMESWRSQNHQFERRMMDLMTTSMEKTSLRMMVNQPSMKKRPHQSLRRRSRAPTLKKGVTIPRRLKMREPRPYPMQLCAATYAPFIEKVLVDME